MFLRAWTDSSGELKRTQDLIANMLGVRRDGVTEGALKLQRAGAIRYARGYRTVLNRAGVEKRTCECDAIVKKRRQGGFPRRLQRSSEQRRRAIVRR
jgi:hypothetical protein